MRFPTSPVRRGRPRAIVALLALGMAGASFAETPSFDCAKAHAGSIESLVCADGALSALDRKLAGVYSEALEKAASEHPPTLKAEQRGWVKGRDECWKSEDKEACVRDEYVHRIAELQARYRLVPAKGPVFYACDGNAANEVVVTFFETDPPTLIAERGDSVSTMFLKSGDNGPRYEGPNESFQENQGDVTVVWGYEVPQMTCKPTSTK